jgi:hypothetical protein
MLIQSCLLITIVGLIGCKTEDKEPHLSDPIYSDIQKLMRKAEEEAQAEAAKAEAAEIQYNKAEVRSIDRKTLKNDLNKAKEAHQKALQMAEYYRIKLKLREAEAKMAYKRAFIAGEDWPQPKEYESYLLQKKLRETSRNWSNHLPKPGETKIPGEEMPEGEGSGGGH